jgi:hypothetical protein
MNRSRIRKAALRMSLMRFTFGARFMRVLIPGNACAPAENAAGCI